MKEILGVTAVSIMLLGCGGSDSGSDNNNTDAVQKIEKDGIYLNTQDLTFMLIDTEQSYAPLIVGDYVANAIYSTDTIQDNGNNSLTTTGVSFTSKTESHYSSNAIINISFTEKTADLTASINSLPIVYSFERTSNSAPLSELTGTFTNMDDGSVWTITENGDFTINGVCIISGTVSKIKGYYESNNATAENCSDIALNGTYNARLVSVKQNGKTHILAAASNSNGTLWGNVIAE